MIKIYNDDYINIVNTLDNNSIDLLLTDPPYIQVKGGCKSELAVKIRGLESDIIKNMSDFYEKDIYLFLDSVKPKMKTFNAYIFCSRLQVVYYLNWALENKLNYDILIWDKMNYGLINRTHFAPNIEYIIRINEKGLNQLDNKTLYYQKIKRYKVNYKKVHPAEKPINLIKEFIELSSNENNTILDCFMGSGVVGLAAMELNRKYIGIEKELKYFNIAKRRLKDDIIQWGLFN